MSLTFPAILVLATFLTGLIWLIDALFFAKKRNLNVVDGKGSEPVIVEYAKSFFPVILIVLILRSFIAEPFRIPSGSMMPTLLVGDFILVNKYVYGVRLPVIHTKLLEVDSPERGDVVVFRYPKDPSTDYIKRVIGEPGDRIGYYDKIVYVNGKPMPQMPVGQYIGQGSNASMSGAEIRVENLTGKNHSILIRRRTPGVEGEFIVPEGHYFMMGDNRDNSNDSRYWGTVPEENLVGKAFMVWMSWDSEGDGVGWDRIGEKIK